jgi:hypothetical protein
MASHEKGAEDHKALETVAGGGAGALIGGIAGLAAGLGAMAIPGIGPVIAAGPLAVAIGSAGIGAATGGVVGALTASEATTPPDLPDQEDQRVEQTPAEHDPVTTASAALIYVDGLEMAPRRSRFEDFAHDYRADFNARNLPAYTYEQLSPAYRYGYTLASDPRFANADWLAVEDYARPEWERENPGTWDQVKEVVRYAWQSRRLRHAAE